MGGKSKKKTTNVYTPPQWVEDASHEAINIGRRIGNTEYEAYGGERVAGLSENEQRGIQMAQDNVGIGQPYFDKAESYAERGTESWADADQSKFINPYIKGALDPAARELREEGARGAMELDARATSMDAFGGSRAALMRGENREATTQALGDLYGKGYADAYNFGAQVFGDERARDMEAAGRFQQLGGAVIDQSQTDISTLMTTGATDRSVQQAMADFDWQEWVTERDWDFRQLMGVIASLEGTKGSYGTESTSETVVKTDNTAEVVGAIAQVVSAAYMGGSDARLKDNIVHLGFGIYTWTWNAIAKALGYDWAPTIGVMAHQHPEHAFVGPHGYLMVNYRSLFGGR